MKAPANTAVWPDGKTGKLPSEIPLGLEVPDESIDAFVARLKSSGFVPALRLRGGQYAVLPWGAVQKTNTYGVPTHIAWAYCPVVGELRPVSFLLPDETGTYSSAWTQRAGASPGGSGTSIAARQNAKPSGPSWKSPPPPRGALLNSRRTLSPREWWPNGR